MRLKSGIIYIINILLFKFLCFNDDSALEYKVLFILAIIIVYSVVVVTVYSSYKCMNACTDACGPRGIDTIRVLVHNIKRLHLIAYNTEDPPPWLNLVFALMSYKCTLSIFFLNSSTYF